MTAQIAIVAPTTAAVVFSRPIAEAFCKARGLALAAAVCAPSLAGALLTPPLTAFIDASGWRDGYRLVGGATLVFGLAAVWLTPRRRASADRRATRMSGMVELRTILNNQNVRLIAVGMGLCSLSITLQTTQLKVVVLGLGLDSVHASGQIALYATGVIIGRLLSGLALDFLPARLVAAIAMALPGVGLLVLASGARSPNLLRLALLTLGLSLGAEGDIAGYLVMSYLPRRIYSMSLGVVIGAISFSAAFGGLLLSGLLMLTGSFAPFLLGAGGAALAGGALFTQLRPAEASPGARSELA